MGMVEASTLMKIAIFGITFSMIANLMIAAFASGQSDYSLQDIQAGRDQLVSFSGETLVNDTPWYLTHVYTPYNPEMDSNDVLNHIDADGWLYGTDVTSYSEIGKNAFISLDKNQKSNQKISVGDPLKYEVQTGKEWWNGGNDWGIVLMDPSIVQSFAWLFGDDDFERVGYRYSSGEANNWNYSGYRYVFDPALPFSSGASSKDGSLSLVWYNYNPPGSSYTETGLSGGLDIYNGGVKLASYSASDIIAGYQSTSGLAQVYDFDFEGTHLNLSIKFLPDALTKYKSLRAAWDDGYWQMAISSASAGNFFDVENSTSFEVTAGSMFDTFIQIYTLKYPTFEDEPLINYVLWLLVGLPMTMAMLFVTMGVVGGVFKFF